MAIRVVFRVKNLSKTYFSTGIGGETNRGWTTISAPARSITTVPHKSKSRNWNEIVQDAERLVGYQEFRGVSVSLGPKEEEKGLNEDIQSVLNKLSSLVGADSPLLKIARNFEPSSSNKGTSQVRGLMVLLVAKLMSGHSTSKSHDTSECDSYGLTPEQRLLAQITEMVYTARLIHRTVTNLQCQEKDGDSTSERSKLEFNNKVAILIGDYLLAKASLSLGKLRNTKVLEMISGTIRNFSEVEFMFRQDLQGKPYPTPTTTLRDWEVKAYLSFASILSNSCRAVLMLSAEDEVPQVRAFEFGKQLGLVWQIHDEMQSFTDVHGHDASAFDLMSIPMIMHLKNDPTILSHILPHHNCLDTADYGKIRSLIKNGTALKESHDLQHKHAQDTLRILNQFDYSECRTVLQNFVTQLSDS